MGTMNGTDSGKLGRLCPTCGHPVRPQDAVCTKCRVPLDVPEAMRWGVFTPFGYGMCGFLAGALAVAGLILSVPGDHLLPLLPLAVLTVGLPAALVTAAIGRRLAPEIRCAYEHLLLAADMAGIAALIPVMSGMRGLEAYLLIWLFAAVIGYGAMRRYGYRPGQR